MPRKKKRYGTQGRSMRNLKRQPPKIFTFNQAPMYVFRQNGKPIFDRPIVCTSDEAELLVRHLNGVTPDLYQTVIDAWLAMKEIGRKPDAEESVDHKQENSMKKVFVIAAIAAICHEANRALCVQLGDNSQVPWDEAPEWQQKSAISGVEFCLANPDAPASANHESWYAAKEADGWVYGEVKDADAKTHPCMVPYDELPAEQQAKDHLFRSIVAGLAPFTAMPSAPEPTNLNSGACADIAVTDREDEEMTHLSGAPDVQAEYDAQASTPSADTQAAGGGF